MLPIKIDQRRITKRRCRRLADRRPDTGRLRQIRLVRIARIDPVLEFLYPSI